MLSRRELPGGGASGGEGSGIDAQIGRPILPPMPWEAIQQTSDKDLKAMFAYLMSLPPVRNMVPAPIPPK